MRFDLNPKINRKSNDRNNAMDLSHHEEISIITRIPAETGAPPCDRWLVFMSFKYLMMAEITRDSSGPPRFLQLELNVNKYLESRFAGGGISLGVRRRMWEF
ncbi:hypothetical protein CEXT_177691 [Caerostris extrusa]|uniref:Uncharacterized protein n=1 Tax=Caerostris extrusa TaxID=172846 RepID=A0AAV4R1Z8_CAEEX|nr:hypothetical protein CEXT_177691 [Caerostris extrusa]